MDRNQVIGFFLIGVLFIGYLFYSQPSKQELEHRKFVQDSIAAVQTNLSKTQVANTVPVNSDSNAVLASVPALASDSIHKDSLKNVQYGAFASAVSNDAPIEYVLENDELKLSFSSKGGQIKSGILKNFKAHNGEPLEVLNPDSCAFSYQFFYQKKSYKTNEFTLEKVDAGSPDKLCLRLKTTEPTKYIDFLYSLNKENKYLVDFHLNIVGMPDLIKENAEEFGFDFNLLALSKEKNLENEKNTSTIYYKYKDDEVDYISERDYERVPLIAKADWIAFKQQFFALAVIPKNGFDKNNAFVETKQADSSPKNIKEMDARTSVRIDQSSLTMQFYVGPNHYQTLKSMENGMENIMDLGWGIFGWVNEYLIIPVFNFLNNFNLGYGLIILLLTIAIKIVLLPITYKNYVSSAKMRILKPEIDLINEKFKDKSPMEKQQATMALYKSSGVNPLAGCIPMLLQMPLLFAMLRFFPSSIELRQQPFLWADDLSSYDSIASLGFNIPFYGDHISLFTILMAITTYLYSKVNMQVTAMSGPQGQQMKIMMYMMPFMLLFFFNSQAAGLTYYYTAANLISIGQQWLIKRYFVDEKALLNKIQLNKMKASTNPPKKSSFQKRLEEMAKQKQNLKK